MYTESTFHNIPFIKKNQTKNQPNNSSKYPALNTHGLASAAQGRPLDARIQPETQQVFHFWVPRFLQRGVVVPESPEIAQRD